MYLGLLLLILFTSETIKGIDIMVSLSHAIQSVLTDCLRVKRAESILIITDPPLSALGYQFYVESLHYSKSPSFVAIPEHQNHATEPPRNIASYMLGHDVIILVTHRSLSHTKARRRACQKGARIASLPAVTKESLTRTLTGKYKEMIDRSRKLADILTIGRSARLVTPAGTDLTFSIARMKGYADTGMIHEPGRFSNLPAGEASTAPVAESTNGVIVIDGSFPRVGLIKTPVRMSVKNGFVVRITGGKEAEQIRKMIRSHGKLGRNIAEVGIGTNPRAKVTGCVLEDEKKLGTVHVGLGNNISFGGKVAVPMHYDGVLLKPTLEIDGKVLLENGELMV